MKPLTTRQKISYLTTYYTKWLVLFLIVCLFVGYFGDAVIQSRKQIVLQGFITNDDYNYFPGSEMEAEYRQVLNLQLLHRNFFHLLFPKYISY
jgi:hypothetical protein